MEKYIAIVDQTNNRVKSVIVVDKVNDDILTLYSSSNLVAIEVKENQTPYLNGIYDGKTYQKPDVDYLIEIGAYPSKEELLRIQKEEERIAAELKTEEEAIG